MSTLTWVCVGRKKEMANFKMCTNLVLQKSPPLNYYQPKWLLLTISGFFRWEFENVIWSSMMMMMMMMRGILIFKCFYLVYSCSYNVWSFNMLLCASTVIVCNHGCHRVQIFHYFANSRTSIRWKISFSQFNVVWKSFWEKNELEKKFRPKIWVRGMYSEILFLM